MELDLPKRVTELWESSRPKIAVQFSRETVWDWVLLAGASFATIWIFIHSSPPGYAIGVLAVVAAIMTFSTPRALQRIAVLILAAALFYLETRAISKDREEQKAASAELLRKVLSDNAEKTNSVLLNNDFMTFFLLSDNQDRFEKNLQKFSEISADDKNIADLSLRNLQSAKQTLLNITGGTSFMYLTPQPPATDGTIRLGIMNPGEYPLTGVNIHIYRTTKFPWHEDDLNIGTVAPRVPKTLNLSISPHIEDKDGPENTDSYWIFMSAQNGLATELLQFRPSKNGGWAYRYTVQREGCRWTKGKCFDGPHYREPSELKADKWSDER